MKKRIISIVLVLILIFALGVTTVSAQPRTVNPTPSTVFVDGEAVEFRAYLIGGNNFFMLRALAYALNGTTAQFSVGWDGTTITLTSGQPYEVVGGETALGDGTPQSATPTAARLILDGEELNLTAYTIGGNNFFRLRDIMQALDVGVIWDEPAQAIRLDTSIGYAEAVDISELPPTPPVITHANISGDPEIVAAAQAIIDHFVQQGLPAPLNNATLNDAVQNHADGLAAGLAPHRSETTSPLFSYLRSIGLRASTAWT